MPLDVAFDLQYMLRSSVAQVTTEMEAVRRTPLNTDGSSWFLALRLMHAGCGSFAKPILLCICACSVSFGCILQCVGDGAVLLLARHAHTTRP